VRLLLDASLSPKRIGGPLTKRGHDVLSLASDAALGALDDPQVLELAAEQSRILVTRNARDFAPLLREWAEADRHHAGCILIWTLAHHEFGAIIRGVTRLLDDCPDPKQWRDLTAAL
jgi:predicted nuclease of predicted toxin-antitoxin system